MTKWSDFLSVAKLLIKNSENSEIKEAHIRSSINRSYFAALCSARDYKKIQNNSSIQNSHQYIINQYSTSKSRTEQRIAFHLIRLKKLRILADYHLNSTILLNHAMLCIELAEGVLDYLSS